MSRVRKAVEESVMSLAAKVISATEDDRPEAAERFASALADATRALDNVSEAEREEDE